MDCSLPGSSIHGIFQAWSPTLKMTAASNTAIWKGSTFVASEVSGGRSQMTEALGLFSGTWHSKGQLRKSSFTKAPSAPLKRVGKCRSAATLWTHLITATLKPLRQGEECSEGLCYAKSLESFPTLCDPIDGSPPGSPVPGILQAKTLEWAAISFSNAWKWKVKVKSLSRVRLLATPWIAAYQAPPSMGFSKQEYWSGVPLPSPPGGCQWHRTQEIGWERYSKENCNRFEFSDANLGQFQEGNLSHMVYNQAGKKNTPRAWSTLFMIWDKELKRQGGITSHQREGGVIDVTFMNHNCWSGCWVKETFWGVRGNEKCKELPGHRCRGYLGNYE